MGYEHTRVTYTNDEVDRVIVIVQVNLDRTEIYWAFVQPQESLEMETHCEVRIMVVTQILHCM